MAAFSGAVGLLAVVALAAVGLVVYSLPESRDSEVVVEVVDPLQQQEAAFVVVLEAAEAALEGGDVAALGRSVYALAGMTAADAELLARRQVVSDAYEVRRVLDTLEPLLASEPSEALEGAQALQRDHPDNVDVVDMVARVEEAVEAARKVAADRPKPRPRPEPAPAPQPGVPSMLSVKGSPEGAEVLVDGRVVGSLPVQVVVDSGRHDVSLRMEGYVQRRVYVDAADGKPLEVSI